MKKTTIIKTLIFLGLFTFCCFSPAFADGSTEALKDANLMINFILSILSRAWIIFAYVAGTLLTNNRVYGEILGIDSFLRICWNMIKNISNFVLGFLFLFYLFRTLISKTTTENMMKGIVVKILVAGIAIQSSRFLTAATIDISTIATAAVGAMPSQIIGSNGDIYLKFKQSTFFKELETSNEMITSKREITLFPEPDKASDEYIYVRKKTIATTGIPEKNLIDSLLPNQNHLAGPLIFIGMGILELNQDITIDINHPIASLLKLIFSGIEIVVYSIAMIFLCIVAFMRVIYLWLFIILSPLLALLSCLKYIGKTEQIDTSKMTDKIMKGLDIKGFINLALKPVIITFGISIALLLSILLKNAVNTKQHTFEMGPGTTIESNITSTENSQGYNSITYDTSIETENINIMLRGASKSFLDMLIGIIVLVLIRFIIKRAITSKTGIDGIDNFTEEGIKKVEKIGGMTKNIPIIPGTGLSYNTAIDTNSGENIFKKRVRAENMEQDEKTSKQSQALAAPFLEALGIEGVNTPLDNYNSGVLLDAAEKKGNEFITKAQEISNNRKITFQDPIWRNAFSKWLDVQFKNPPRNNLFSGCKWEGNSSDEKLENLFKDERARKIYENNFKTIKSTSNRNELKSEKAFQKTN